MDEETGEVVASKKVNKEEFENGNEEKLSRGRIKDIDDVDEIDDKYDLYESDDERDSFSEYSFELTTYVSLLSTDRDADDFDLDDINRKSDFNEFDEKSAYYIHVDLDYDQDGYSPKRVASNGKDFVSVYWTTDHLEVLAEEIDGDYKEFYGCDDDDLDVRFRKEKDEGNGMTWSFDESLKTRRSGTVPIEDIDIKLILKPEHGEDGSFKIRTSYNHTYYALGTPSFSLSYSGGLAIGGIVSGSTKSWQEEDSCGLFYY